MLSCRLKIGFSVYFGLGGGGGCRILNFSWEGGSWILNCGWRVGVSNFYLASVPPPPHTFKWNGPNAISTHLPSICHFTHPHLLISALSMHRPPVLWVWICAPANHFFGARILRKLSFSTLPAVLAPLCNTTLPPFQ